MTNTPLTSKASTRWEWLGTIVAGATIATFLGLIVAAALGVTTLTTLASPWNWLLAAGVASAYAYALGKDVYQWRKEAKNE